MIEFRDALTDLLDEFSTDEHAYKPDLPEGRHMHVDNKNFYFDIGKNLLHIMPIWFHFWVNNSISIYTTMVSRSENYIPLKG